MTGQAGEDGYETPRLLEWRRWTDSPLLILAIGSLPLLLLEIDRDQLTDADGRFLDVLNIVVLVAFSIDYLVELWLARNRRTYLRQEWTSLLIVVAQGLVFIPGLAGLGALRALRGARALRVGVVMLRLAAIGGAARAQGRARLRRQAGTLALGVAGLTWLTAAVGFTLAEDVGEGGRIHSFFDSVWWASATITTVGYGDVAPVTVGGRLIGIATMIVGISTFAVVTAKVAEWLVRGDREEAQAAAAARLRYRPGPEGEDVQSTSAIGAAPTE